MNVDIFKKPSYEDRLPVVDEITEENEPNWESLVQLQNLRIKQTDFDSPIDINLTTSEPITLSSLSWFNYHTSPKKIKFTNTGRTGIKNKEKKFDVSLVILSAKFHEERPYIIGGPLMDAYVFSQLHFHWGRNNMEGSEHTIDGSKQPMEMHVVHYKTSYSTQEAALMEPDGIIILVYLFQLQGEANPMVQVLTDNFGTLNPAPASVRLPSFPLAFFFRMFVNDYYMYSGSIETQAKRHHVLWLISREPIGISIEQLLRFRALQDMEENYMLSNWRETHPIGKRKMFHVNPGPSQYATLLQIPKELTLELQGGKKASFHF